jgi:2-polyprenyl-6-methoxyphenol hydroxylase-like FAD-dependent oxidoreductase
MAAQTQLGEVAIVIGGSMAGLLAARVLAERFAQVMILERDACPIEALPRKGTPQAQHAHALLAKGQLIIEELFPGLTEQLIALGAIRGFGRFFAGGGFIYPAKHGPGDLFVSRPLLETQVRARLLAMPNVRLLDRCPVQRLLLDETSTRVCGVQIERRDADVGKEHLVADLVVDASGRGSRMVEWLKTLGYPVPDVDVVEVSMAYATRLYRREAKHLDGDLMALIAPTVDNVRGCGMLAQEGDRWIVTLAGYFGDRPPTDEAGFLAFAKRLPIADVYDFIRMATPLSAPVSYLFPANQRRRYERLTRFPTGLLVMGDAVCSFTPIYGQGMTVAALEALELRNCLEAGTDHLATRFFKQIAKHVDIAWSLAADNDRRLAQASYRPSVARRLLDWYMDRLLIAARTNPDVASAFLAVSDMMAAPTSLLRPPVAWRVIKETLRWKPPQPELVAQGSISGGH